MHTLAGLGWAGLGWAGLGWAGLGWAGLGWAGLGWAGLGWAGLGWAGLGWGGVGWGGVGARWGGVGRPQGRPQGRCQGCPGGRLGVAVRAPGGWPRGREERRGGRGEGEGGLVEGACGGVRARARDGLVGWGLAQRTPKKTSMDGHLARDAHIFQLKKTQGISQERNKKPEQIHKETTGKTRKKSEGILREHSPTFKANTVVFFLYSSMKQQNATERRRWEHARKQNQESRKNSSANTREKTRNTGERTRERTGDTSEFLDGEYSFRGPHQEELHFVDTCVSQVAVGGWATGSFVFDHQNNNDNNKAFDTDRLTFGVNLTPVLNSARGHVGSLRRDLCCRAEQGAAVACSVAP